MSKSYIISDSILKPQSLCENPESPGRNRRGCNRAQGFVLSCGSRWLSSLTELVNVEGGGLTVKNVPVTRYF